MRLPSYNGLPEAEERRRVRGALMLSDSRIVMRFACAVVFATGAAGAIGQAGTPNATANSELPSFEVASIKPTTGGIAGFRTYPGGRTQCSYCTVWMIID